MLYSDEKEGVELFDCNGRYSRGSIEKSDWVLRVMVGFEF